VLLLFKERLNETLTQYSNWARVRYNVWTWHFWASWISYSVYSKSQKKGRKYHLSALPIEKSSYSRHDYLSRLYSVSVDSFLDYRCNPFKSLHVVFKSSSTGETMQQCFFIPGLF
jgi:hypothetical protein